MDSKKKHPWLHGFGERPRSIWPMVPRCSSSTGGGHWVGQGSEMKCIFLCILLIDSRTFQYCIYRLYIIIYRYSCATMIIYSFAYICIYTHLDCRLHLIIYPINHKTYTYIYLSKIWASKCRASAFETRKRLTLWDMVSATWWMLWTTFLGKTWGLGWPPSRSL